MSPMSEEDLSLARLAMEGSGLDDCECSAITTTEQVAAMYEEASDLQAQQPDSGRLG